jgi:recombination protein RecA
MSATLLRYVPIAAETNTLVIFINQVRHKVGGYGNPETTSGGLALGFYATGRIRVSGVGAKANRILDNDGNVIGHKTIFEIVKNKLNTPFTKSTVNLIYGNGYDMVGEVITIATDLGILTRKGSWFSYEDKNIGQGENGVRKFFEENNDVFMIIKNEVSSILGIDKYYDKQKERDKKVE